MSKRITIARPDDFHLHLRDGATMEAVLPHSAEHFARAMIMPNLKPALTTVELVDAYRNRILSALPTGSSFEPLMTLYLTDKLTPALVRELKVSGKIIALKLYPAGATTNADDGVEGFESILPVLEAAAEVGLPLAVHGEVADPAVDMFDRETRFIDDVLIPLRAKVPGLKVILEHLTTAGAVDYVLGEDETMAATFTCHHLLMTRQDLFLGGFNPHNFCLPILKTEADRQRLLEAVAMGSPKFFLGTDSAPHPRSAKENGKGYAGIYSAYSALPLYAEAFDSIGQLDKLEAFASHYGADFYGLPRNEGTITLVQEEAAVPATLPLGDDVVVPLRAGGSTQWRVEV